MHAYLLNIFIQLVKSKWALLCQTNGKIWMIEKSSRDLIHHWEHGTYLVLSIKLQSCLILITTQIERTCFLAGIPELISSWSLNHTFWKSPFLSPLYCLPIRQWNNKDEKIEKKNGYSHIYYANFKLNPVPVEIFKGSGI